MRTRPVDGDIRSKTCLTIQNRCIIAESKECAMDAGAHRQAWNDQGYFVLRGLVDAAEVKAIEDEVIARIRADPPQDHVGETLYPAGPNYAIFTQKAPSPTAVNPEDRIAKVFNCHAEGRTRRAAESAAILDVVAGLLGPDPDCFHSQFIFKNP